MSADDFELDPHAARVIDIATTAASAMLAPTFEADSRAPTSTPPGCIRAARSRANDSANAPGAPSGRDNTTSYPDLASRPGRQAPVTTRTEQAIGTLAGMDACDALDTLAADPELAGRLVHRELLRERPAQYADVSTPLLSEVADRIAARGVDRLYTHQARAIDHLRSGTSVVIATGTASGKSLCYQVPIVESVVADRRDTALLLFPTKALAHDQLRSLRSWLVPGMRAVTFDGDTETDDRKWARKNANVVLTNPDMLHVGILPSHQRWATFMMRLRYVVVDELHTQRGIFGSHVAHVLRRLRRICEHYGANPTFCFASATIGNPGALASELCGLPVEQIDVDGSPRSERVLACWQRPLLD